MPAPATSTLFGRPDLKVDARLLSVLAFMASAEKPVETPNLVGDYAMSEMCVSDAETADIKMYLDTLRTGGQQHFVSELARKIRADAAQARNRAAAKVADSLEDEMAHLVKVFFLRVRSYEVFRVSTDESVGRFVCFPDQVSDDYGNNLEERNEKGVIQSLVDRSHGAEKLPTVYVGHGQGAAMAELCGCATGRQAIIFDGSLLSSLLVANAVAHKCVQSEPLNDGETKSFNIINYRTQAVADAQNATLKPILAAAAAYAADEKAAQEAAAKEAAKKGTAKKEPAKDKKQEEQEKAAEDWFVDRKYFIIGGIVSAAATARFERTGRYNAKSLSDMLVDYTASIRAAADPFKSQ